MSNYTKTTNFTAKDSLPTGNANKKINGSLFDTEFDALATAVSSKADTAAPTFTGLLTAASGTFSSTLGVTGLITATAGITSGSNIVSDTDSTDDLGSTGVRWANLWVDDITVTTSITAGGDITGLTVKATGDTSAGDAAAMGYTATEGLVLTGQGSSNDITLKNDADATVIAITTGTSNVAITGNALVAGTMRATQPTDNFAGGSVRAIRSSNSNQYATLANYGGASWLAAVDEGNLGNDILVFGKSVDGSTFTEHARFTTGGDLQMASGNGIYLGGTAAANLLDDYEEGTFSPTYTTSGTDFDSITMDASAYGAYTKVGRLVVINSFFRSDSITVGSATGNARAGGLPFTLAASKEPSFYIGNAATFTTNFPQQGLGVASSTTISLYYNTGNSASSALAIANLGTGANQNNMYLAGAYEV